MVHFWNKLLQALYFLLNIIYTREHITLQIEMIEGQEHVLFSLNIWGKFSRVHAHKKIPLLNVTFFCLKAIERDRPDELTTVYLHKFHLKSLSINNKLGVSSTLCMVQHLDKHVNRCNGITKKFNGPLSIYQWKSLFKYFFFHRY